MIRMPANTSAVSVPANATCGHIDVRSQLRCWSRPSASINRALSSAREPAIGGNLRIQRLMMQIHHFANRVFRLVKFGSTVPAGSQVMFNSCHFDQRQFSVGEPQQLFHRHVTVHVAHFISRQRASAFLTIVIARRPRFPARFPAPWRFHGTAILPHASAGSSGPAGEAHSIQPRVASAFVKS